MHNHFNCDFLHVASLALHCWLATEGNLAYRKSLPVIVKNRWSS